MKTQKVEVAKKYLGNLSEDKNLAEKIESAKLADNYIEVFLIQSDRHKGRIQAESTSGVNIGIIKDRDWALRPDDVFQTESGQLLLIHLQEQKVMVLSFTKPATNQGLKLLHLGHTLGNHHWPIAIHHDKIYLQLIVDEAIVEKTIRDFEIPGLHFEYEWRSPQQSLHFAHHHH